MRAGAIQGKIVERTFLKSISSFSLESQAIHAVADFKDFEGHAGGVAEEADLAAGDVRPIDGELDDAAAEFAEEETKLDIEGEADALLVGADFFESGSAEDFQSTLGIVGWHVAHD